VCLITICVVCLVCFKRVMGIVLISYDGFYEL
jgi:hypothetical protein